MRYLVIISVIASFVFEGCSVIPINVKPAAQQETKVSYGANNVVLYDVFKDTESNRKKFLTEFQEFLQKHYIDDKNKVTVSVSHDNYQTAYKKCETSYHLDRCNNVRCVQMLTPIVERCANYQTGKNYKVYHGHQFKTSYIKNDNEIFTFRLETNYDGERDIYIIHAVKDGGNIVVYRTSPISKGADFQDEWMAAAIDEINLDRPKIEEYNIRHLVK